MEYKTVQEAIKEAERFIRAAKELKQDYWYVGSKKNLLPKVIGGGGAATCKRASMDLTRILARLRGGK